MIKTLSRERKRDASACDSSCSRPAACAARLHTIRFARLVRFASRRTLQPLPQPGREATLGELAFGKGEHRDVLFLVGCDEFGAIQRDKGSIGEVRRALVAVDKRMIAR